MRTIKVEYNVYNIEELEKDALEVALEEVRNLIQRDYYSFEYQDFLQSVDTFLEEFGLRTIDWYVGVFDRNYIEDNSCEYREINDNKAINNHVKFINNMIKEFEEGRDYLITGVYTDDYIYDYFKHNRIKQVSYNDIHKHLQNVINHALDKFITMLEENILNKKYIIEFANVYELEFLSSGELSSEEIFFIK